MMDFEQLIEYDFWANRRIFDEIENLPESDARIEIQRLFSHILAAQLIWYNRAEGVENSVAIWPELSLQEMKQLVSENPDKLKKLCSMSKNAISYNNSKGKSFQNTVDQILMHLIIHGQHHRAQIATLLRKAGVTPPATDFIVYMRKI